MYIYICVCVSACVSVSVILSTHNSTVSDGGRENNIKYHNCTIEINSLYLKILWHSRYN